MIRDRHPGLSRLRHVAIQRWCTHRNEPSNVLRHEFGFDLGDRLVTSRYRLALDATQRVEFRFDLRNAVVDQGSHPLVVTSNI